MNTALLSFYAALLFATIVAGQPPGTTSGTTSGFSTTAFSTTGFSTTGGSTRYATTGGTTGEFSVGTTAGGTTGAVSTTGDELIQSTTGGTTGNAFGTTAGATTERFSVGTTAGGTTGETTTGAIGGTTGAIVGTTGVGGTTGASEFSTAGATTGEFSVGTTAVGITTSFSSGTTGGATTGAIGGTTGAIGGTTGAIGGTTASASRGATTSFSSGTTGEATTGAIGGTTGAIGGTTGATVPTGSTFIIGYPLNSDQDDIDSTITPPLFYSVNRRQDDDFKFRAVPFYRSGPGMDVPEVESDYFQVYLRIPRTDTPSCNLYVGAYYYDTSITIEDAAQLIAQKMDAVLVLGISDAVEISGSGYWTFDLSGVYVGSAQFNATPTNEIDLFWIQCTGGRAYLTDNQDPSQSRAWDVVKVDWFPQGRVYGNKEYKVRSHGVSDIFFGFLWRTSSITISLAHQI